MIVCMMRQRDPLRAGLFRNEAVVLTHFSQRYPAEEIREALGRLPAGLAGRIRPFLPGG